MIHPANETNKMIFLHGWVPALLALIVLASSVAADLIWPGDHWMMRSGAVVTVLGAYVAYRDAKRTFKEVNGDVYINTMLPYRLISVFLVVIGTFVWGYGDLIL